MKITSFYTMVLLFFSSMGSLQVSRSEDYMSTCMNAVINLSSCLDFITKTSVDHPTPVCCGALKNILDSQPLCLCTTLDGEVSSAFGIAIDPKRALQLPPICGLRTPPVSLCNLLTNSSSSNVDASHPPAAAVASAAGPTKSTSHGKSLSSPRIVSSGAPILYIFSFYLSLVVLGVAFV